MTKEKERYETRIDASTGQRLFKPKIKKSHGMGTNDHAKFLEHNRELKIDTNESLFLEHRVLQEKRIKE